MLVPGHLPGEGSPSSLCRLAVVALQINAVLALDFGRTSTRVMEGDGIERDGRDGRHWSRGAGDPLFIG